MNIDEKNIEQIIVAGNPEKLVTEAEAIGRFLSKDLSTSQIRSVFGTVKKISQAWSPNSTEEEGKGYYRQILLLKPKMAYQEGRAGRQQKEAIKSFRLVLDHSIKYIQGDVTKFKRFAEFFEAILAYHKAYGGK